MRISPSEAQAQLETGGVVALPTETVYGLAACLKYPKTIDRIFTLKGRPNDNPLIIHLAKNQDIAAFTDELPEGFDQLAAAFWPGPMTLVVKVKQGMVPQNACAGLPTAAFRVPGHEMTRKLIELTGPLVMPSANVSGRPSSTTPEHVEQDFGAGFPVLDGGPCMRGIESTILIHEQGSWKIIRQGIIEPNRFKAILGYEPSIVHAGEKPLCPGQLYRHYAPKAKLLLTTEFSSPAVILGFSDVDYPTGSRIFAFGPKNHPEMACENLYRLLRQLDEEKVEEVKVDMRFPWEGLWLTLSERLRKAAVH